MRFTSERGVWECIFSKIFYWEIMIPDSTLVGKSRAFKYMNYYIELKLRYIRYLRLISFARNIGNISYNSSNISIGNNISIRYNRIKEYKRI